MARRPFDPAEHGWQRTDYRRGDILDRDSVEGLVADADVVVHLAFIIFGDHDEAHRVNLEGSRNVFEATAASSAAAARLHVVGRRVRLRWDGPRLAHRGHARGGDQGLLLLRPQGRARGAAGADRSPGPHTEAYVFRPCIVAGADAPTLVCDAHHRQPADGRARTAAPGARAAPGGAAGAARHRRPVSARPPRRRRSCDRGGGGGGGRARASTTSPPRTRSPPPTSPASSAGRPSPCRRRRSPPSPRRSTARR